MYITEQLFEKSVLKTEVLTMKVSLNDLLVPELNLSKKLSKRNRKTLKILSQNQHTEVFILYKD